MKRLACLGILLGLIVPVLALAAKTPVEASMVLTGTITVNPDGSVRGYALHDEDKVPPGVRQIVQATVPHWQFEPITADGKPIIAKTGMSLRIVADVGADNKATVRVAGAQFGCNADQAKALLQMACQPNRTVWYGRREPPSYPNSALMAGVGGEVFLVLQVDRSGHVAQVATSQVNLYVRATHADEFRKVLADNAIAAAKKWTFRVPTAGAAAAKDRWIVRVPVDYTIAGSPGRNRRYGHWTVYVRGPVRVIPWADGDSKPGAHANGDAIAGNGALFIRDGRFVLKTPLAGNGSQS
jgi:hypothetical protein